MLHNVMHRFFAYPSFIHGILKFGEKFTVFITCSSHVLFMYTLLKCQFSNVGQIYHHGSPWGDQYRQFVGFKFSTTTVPGSSIGFFHIQTTMICGIGKIIGGGGVMCRSYLGLFFLVVEHGTTVSGYSWCQICSYPTKHYH